MGCWTRIGFLAVASVLCRAQPYVRSRLRSAPCISPPASPQGQVFPRMRNFTPNHRMTGVGNALKRHYQVFLLDYEQVGWRSRGAGWGRPRLNRETRAACPKRPLDCCAGDVLALHFWAMRCWMRHHKIRLSHVSVAPPSALHPHTGAPRRHHGRPLRHLRARRRARQRLDLMRRLQHLGALLM